MNKMLFSIIFMKQGSSTSALSHLLFLSYPVCAWWIYVRIGLYTILNNILHITHMITISLCLALFAGTIKSNNR